VEDGQIRDPVREFEERGEVAEEELHAGERGKEGNGDPRPAARHGDAEPAEGECERPQQGRGGEHPAEAVNTRPRPSPAAGALAATPR
jgi:hypothetical protein